MRIEKHRRYPLIRECKGLEIGLDSLQAIGAHSVGIGRKRVEGRSTDTPCLRYYVAKKKPLSKISSEERIPKRIVFVSRKSAKTSHIPTDVIELPPAEFEEVDPERSVRPVPGGCSAGANGHAGTIGAWVWDLTDDTVVMLSNEHVFEQISGKDILQPATTDGGVLPNDRIGSVKRGVPRSVNEVNRVDCSIGDVDEIALCDPQVLEIGPALFATDTPEVDMPVEKYGQTTRHTFGEITDSDWSGFVSGRPFEDCLLIDPAAPSSDWSAGGDSGSLVFSRTPIDEESGIKPGVGLHFAGAGNFGIACKIQNVLAALDLATLSTGAFTAFFDSLSEVESDGAVSEESETGLRNVAAAAARTPAGFSFPAFTRRERRQVTSFFRGLTGDLYRRIAETEHGRTLGAAAEAHRAELFTLLVRDGDIRRATVMAFRPLLAGATTTSDVLERVLMPRDLANLRKLADELARKASDKMRDRLKVFQTLGGAAGKNLSQILGIEL